MCKYIDITHSRNERLLGVIPAETSAGHLLHLGVGRTERAELPLDIQ